MTGPVCQGCGEPIPAERAAYMGAHGREPKYCSKRCADRVAQRVWRERHKGRKTPPVPDPGRADWWCLTCGHRIADERAANTVSSGREPKYCCDKCARQGSRRAYSDRRRGGQRTPKQGFRLPVVPPYPTAAEVRKHRMRDR